MTSKMLIDASHPEETRLVVLRGDRVEEFDFESAARKLLRGNIYLAKVTRVEPSLQAAFVEYGGNRHGFLAFSDIHPDYYQIPIADRQALLAAEAEAAEEEEQPRQDGGRRRRGRTRDGARGNNRNGRRSEALDPNGNDEHVGPGDDAPLGSGDDAGGWSDQPAEGGAMAADTDRDMIREDRSPSHAGADDVGAGPDDRSDDNYDDRADAPRSTGHQVGLVEDEGVEEIAEDDEADSFEQVGSEDAMEEVPERRRRPLRSYKIQEVVRRRQIMLVQVVKEERGNKGAALTTYLSLAGRYTVLMPNTGRGGGISRKITNALDRKRLKEIATDLEVPEGMGLIVRTAGAARTQQEIKRDFEYLLRLWESVRDLTLRSTAPALVYEEGDLIRRSLRDLYSADIDEVVVAGDAAYAEARDFMRMLMPSHAKNVKHFQETEPLFTRYQIERQLSAMYSPYVTLKSGGYIVINQTEALVSIDVNSGKSTREHSIEETALATNMEASSEIARQLKLRDLAGLVVIDFIDMEERRNNRSVERRLKDSLRHDRARIQLGRISHFGLLEMSRQRLRTGVVEGSTSQCPHCLGTGIIRSTESVALTVIRGIEEKLVGGGRHNLMVTTSIEAALYILNEKRDYLQEMEARHGITITVAASDKLHGANFTIERGAISTKPVDRKQRSAVQMDWTFAGAEDEAVSDDAPHEPAGEPIQHAEIEMVEEEEDAAPAPESDGQRSKRKRRRRGRGGERAEGQPEARLNGRHHHQDIGLGEQPDGPDDRVESIGGEGSDGEEAGEPVAAVDERGDGEPRRSRRRGRRGGRRNRRGERGEAEPLASRLEPGGSDLVAVAYEPGDGQRLEPVSRADDAAAGSPATEEARLGEGHSRPSWPGQEFDRPGPGSSASSRSFERDMTTPDSEIPITAFVVEERPAERDHRGDEIGVTSDRPPVTHAAYIEPHAPDVPAPTLVPEVSVVEETPAGPPRRGWWQKRD